MTAPVDQRIYKPRLIMARHQVGPVSHPAEVIHEPFVLPSGKGNSKLVLPAIRQLLLGLSFEDEWLDQFMLAADEAMSNACEHGNGSTVPCLLTIIQHGQEQFVSLWVDNAINTMKVELPDEDHKVDFAERLSAERGRGFGMMQQLMDGLVINIVPGRTLQAVISSDHRRT